MALRADLLPALAAFEAAARHQNFAHAGEELHLTASAVSHHVRKLESRLGVSLFQRHARGVSLTAEGRQLADAASSSLADLDDVLHGVRAKRDDANLLRIATLHSFTCAWLLPRLASFARAHPDIRIGIETGFALARFEEGGPDLAIRYGPGHWPGLSSQLLMEETLFPVASRHLPGFDNVHSAADVARLPLLGDGSRHGWHDWFRLAKVRGVTPDLQYRFSDTTAALAASAHGLGAVLARDRITETHLRDGSLTRLPGPSLRSRWSYYVVHPSHLRLREPARLFVEWLLQLRESAAPADDASVDQSNIP